MTRPLALEELSKIEDDVNSRDTPLFTAHVEDMKLLLETCRLLYAAHDYVSHENRCVLNDCSAGEPTPGGGYRQKFGDKWYQAKPVDETPKCDCGLAEAMRPFTEEK